jgi:hypothetical protein
MALPDLTGQNIENTYQRILHTDGTLIYDGTGSVVNLPTESFVTTSSFNSFTSSYNTGSFTGSFTGSLFGTASFAVSASWAPTLSFIKRSATTGSFTYCGTALSGSLETENVWDITRILITLEGTTTSEYATQVAWTDREIIIYN